ncbi:unnamed protein product [Gulo gulo]|uniref:Uncharacterized protein n=1 Tax=Gulo gulo TaxID=48420 RepID=A0A9X9LWR5_GULGU|nr:unnamed protein product [Gulo gulo]
MTTHRVIPDILLLCEEGRGSGTWQQTQAI